MLEKNNQGCALHVEREAIGPIAVQILNNQRNVLLHPLFSKLVI
jgi:hypothetical protein